MFSPNSTTSILQPVSTPKLASTSRVFLAATAGPALTFVSWYALPSEQQRKEAHNKKRRQQVNALGVIRCRLPEKSEISGSVVSVAICFVPLQFGSSTWVLAYQAIPDATTALVDLFQNKNCLI
jgi:hypothetical protein